MINLSFLLTTYNKRETLEIVLEHYITNRKDNYELIVSDGGSTDGTPELLTLLAKEGKIDRVILSEGRDRGEWEGYKKTLEHMTGQYFYLLTDDDYFDFVAIDRVLDWLNQHAEVDYLIADGLDLKTTGKVEVGRYHGRMKWMRDQRDKGKESSRAYRVFLEEGACGLGLFVRSNLATALDLFSPKFGKRTDKTVTNALFTSAFVAASTDTRTYVSIKNEKSNSVLYQYDYSKMEKIGEIEPDPSKDFLADTDLFRQKFDSAQHLLDQCPYPTSEQFVIYGT